MSQGQPRRPQPQEARPLEPIKHGNVFHVSGKITNKPISARDATMMPTSEATILGRVESGGTDGQLNERAGLVGRGDVRDVAGDQGVTIAAMDYPGRRIHANETVAGQDAKLTADKAATAKDAEALIRAVNNPNLTASVGGVAAAVAAAARFNERAP